MVEYDPSEERGIDGNCECPGDGCERVFGTLRGVSVHHTKAHGERLDIESTHERRYKQDAEFLCSKCEKSFETEHGLKTHHSKAHGEKLGAPDCDWCGENTGKSPCRVERSDHQFCDEDCRKAWETENCHVEIACDWCGMVETTPRWQAKRKNHHFCSTGHRDLYNSEIRWVGEANPNYVGKLTVPCDYCGGDMEIYPSEQWKPHHFHDRPCYEAWFSENRSGEDSPHYEGGPAVYGAGWNDAKKELIRERDGRECRICGKSELEHVEEHGRKHTVHHIVKARDLKDAPSEVRNGSLNLVTMCRDHHLSGWERISPVLQFMVFLPHPSLPGEQTTLTQTFGLGD